ncbi:dihydroxy-acid dehydratase [Anaerotignum sp.]|uniref:dihydroxy-acid dehydratase n=1 Tax=Anaerotignum sp. TaxID=2039241 RepID=UPI0028A97E3F|nr:dihydroxy-acid dehydratase [Anaerotignum sp.]
MFIRSKDILSGPEWANVRALYKSSGFTDDEMKKPIIAVVNAYNSVCPGHFLLQQVSQRVKEGISAAGGMAVEFGVIGACDGVAMGHNGMKHILPGREILANEIETMMEAHRLDGMVLIGSCDKIVPGMLMGAVRVNLPTVFINGGPTLPGRMKENNPYGGEYIDHSIIQQSEGALKAGLISQEQFDWIENNAVPTPGSCAMLGTANTMCCLAEALGMALPGAAAIPAVYSKRLAMAYDSGKAVMALVEKDIKPRDIITKESIINAVKVNSAIGGSTNAVLHLLAIAYEAEIDFNIFEFGDEAKDVPHLVPMIPAGQYTLLDFYEAGGVQAIMAELQSVLDIKGMTCTTKSLEDNLKDAKNYNLDVIRPLANPVHSRGGIGILTGNLASHGSVTKPSAIPEDALYFKGKAKIFESEQDALTGIRNHEVRAGEVVVIRNEGPKGGPGMPEMYKAMKLLVGMDLGSKVCVITDGRFSGSNNGCFVGHICPEAADDGNIAYLEDGDTIVVDVKNGSISAEVDFEARRSQGKRSKTPQATGYLYQYYKNVRSASEGAVIPVRD